MTFSKALDAWILSEEDHPVNHAILCYLKEHAMGSSNAKSWNKISSALGLTISKNTFQQGLLKKSREGNLFIGSNDHGESSGYFIIDDAKDAEIMMCWYRRRIAVEQRHLDHLMMLNQAAGLGPIPIGRD
jgi:hypothetical protein